MRALMTTVGSLIFAAGFAAGDRPRHRPEPRGSPPRLTAAPPPPRNSARHSISGSHGRKAL